MVLTDDSYQGEDAAELVSVDYEPLPAVVGLDAALAGETLLFPDAGSNVAVGGGPAADDGVVRRLRGRGRARPSRTSGSRRCRWRAGPPPPRWADGKLTVWVSTQNAQIARFILAGALGLDPGAIRVIAPGRGRRVRRQDRRRPGRDPGRLGGQAHRPGAALGGDAQREPARDDARAAPSGRPSRSAAPGTAASWPTGSTSSRTPAPTRGWAASCPFLTRLMAVGPYDIAARARPRTRSVVTNTTPIAAYRGAGRPGGDRRDRAGRGPVRRRDRHGPGRGAAA